MNRLAPALAAAAVVAALLSGCTATATYTVSPEDLATTAENALEQQVGSRPDIDCGTEDIDLVKGTVVPCILTDPASGDRFDAPVTIEEVDGSNYTIGVGVADAPKP